MNNSEENNPEPDITLIEFIKSKVPDFKIYEYAHEDGVYFLYGHAVNDPKEVVKQLWVPLNTMIQCADEL